MALFEKKDDIFRLMEKFEKSSIMELELEAGEGIRIKLSKINPRQLYLPESQVYSSGDTEYSSHTIMHHIDAQQPAQPSVPVDDPVIITANEKVIKAPIIGTFYSSPSPEAAPYVKAGDKVAKGAIICILEAMKVMNEIECEQDCEIAEILVNNGELVEYGQPMFKIK